MREKKVREKKRMTRRARTMLLMAIPFLIGLFLSFTMGNLDSMAATIQDKAEHYKIRFCEDEAEIGDFKSEDFRPHIKLKRWGEECSLSIELPDAEVPREKKSVALRANKIEWTSPDLDAYFYKKDREEIVKEDMQGKKHTFIINENGGMEFELVLKARPASNVISLPIETKGLKFYYQDPLTQREIKMGAVRPEEVVGSYAVYHESRRGGKYKTGKAFHIYRPKIIDRNGDWIWGELNIDEKKGVLIITIDRAWLETAVYPVVVDPTFGYDTKGASSISIENVIRGSTFTEGAGETIDTITAYLQNTDAAATHVAKCAIYNMDSSLKAYAAEVTIPVSMIGWYRGTLSSSTVLSASTDYILVAWGDNSNAKIYYDDVTPTTQGRSQILTYGTWPNPASFSSDTYKYSIYGCCWSCSATATFNITATLDDTLPSSSTATFNITATLDDTFPPSTATFNITATLASQLAFTTAEQTIVQNAASSIMTVEIQDANGNAVTVLTDTTINLTSSSAGGSFSLNSSPWQSITSVTISSGSSSASFYYKDSNVGTPTITAAESPSVGLTDATQTITVKSAVNSFSVSASSPQVAGSAFTLTITALDADGNTATSYSDPVTISLNYVSPLTGTGTLSVTSTSSFSNGVATITNQSYPDAGTITITATKSDDSSKTGTSSNIVFVPYDFTVMASSLDTSASGSAYARHTVAKPFTLTITARNASGVTCPNYKGTANLTINYTSPSTSQSGSLGTSSLTSTYWTNGVATISDQTYNKWGTITITATDATLTTRTGTSSNIIFIPKDFSISLSSPPASRTYYYTNEAFSATVTARDYNNTTISNYQGTISFTGSGLTLPSNYTFTTTDAGSHKFTGINGSSEASTTLSVKDTTYASITGTSSTITLKAGTIKVISNSGPVGSISVQVKILDSSGNVLTEDDSTTFTVTITEFMKDNNTCTSTATSAAATVTDGIATITLKDTEPETVTVTPSATPTLTAIAGTVRFGTVSGSGVGVQLWREIRGQTSEEKEEH